jgi:hypothetical protein
MAQCQWIETIALAPETTGKLRCSNYESGGRKFESLRAPHLASQSDNRKICYQVFAASGEGWAFRLGSPHTPPHMHTRTRRLTKGGFPNRLNFDCFLAGQEGLAMVAASDFGMTIT